MAFIKFIIKFYSEGKVGVDMERKFLAKAITLGLLLAMPLGAEAGTPLENNATGTNALAIGVGTTADKLGSIAIGGTPVLRKRTA